MNIDSNNISINTHFWKLGCNWGSNEPSFYEVLKANQVVISYVDLGPYNIGDIILVAEGYSVLALARINSKHIPINTNNKLVNALSKKNVSDFGNIFYYKTDFFEIPEKDKFKYRLQQGRVKVRAEKIIANSIKIWEEYKNQKKLDLRIMRLTWNSNNWEMPCGHRWNYKNQGKTSIAYENQYGYGHEEWLFNERFRIDGFQYGYIRGVNNLSEDVEIIDQITLYTIREDKQRCLVGNLYNVEIIEGIDDEEQKISDLISDYMPTLIDELNSVNADSNQFKKDYLLPNVKFKWDEAALFNEPVPVDFLDGAEFNRFQAYHLKDELLNPIQAEFEKQAKFNFLSGKASNTGEYTKTTSKTISKVRRRHGEITDDLYDYLLAIGNSENNISVEKTRVGGAIVDVALKVKNGFTLFEAKTSNSAIKNIRQALGQILEYALLDGDINCNKLIIVGPAKLTPTGLDYFERLKSLITTKIEYWEYKPNEKNIKDKFDIK